MQPWKTVKRETAFHHSKWLTVENHTIDLPDGKRLTEWPWIITPDFINVIAITEQGTISPLPADEVRGQRGRARPGGRISRAE